MIPGIPNPISGIGDLIGGAAESAADGALELIMAFWFGLVADAVASVTEFLIDAMNATTQVSLTSGWWVSAEAQAIWRYVLGISAGLLLFFYLLQTVKGLATGDTVGLLRTIVVSLPTVVLSTVSLVAVTSVILTATDEATMLVTAGLGENLGEFSALMGTADALSNSGLLGMLFALLYVLGALFIWIQLVIRASLIYVLIMFAPLAFAARVFDSSRHVSRRIIEIGLALILSKFAIGLTLATGAAAVAGGSTIGPEEGSSVDYTAMIAGPSIMILGAFMPSVLYRLIPVFEGAAITTGIASAPLRTVSTIGGLAFAGASIARLAGGGASSAATRTPTPAVGSAPPAASATPLASSPTPSVAIAAAATPPGQRDRNADPSAPGGIHAPPP